MISLSLLPASFLRFQALFAAIREFCGVSGPVVFPGYGTDEKLVHYRSRATLGRTARSSRCGSNLKRREVVCPVLAVIMGVEGFDYELKPHAEARRTPVRLRPRPLSKF